MLIESCFRTVQWCNDNVPNAVRLFYRNIDVDSYNRTEIVKSVECPARNTIVGYTIVERNCYKCRLMYQMSVSECRT